MTCLNNAANFLKELLDQQYCPKVQAELVRISGDIEHLQYVKTQSLLSMSKAKYYQEGERNSRYFFSMSRARSLNKTMFRIKDDKGIITTDSNSILTLQREY